MIDPLTLPEFRLICGSGDVTHGTIGELIVVSPSKLKIES